MTLPITMPQNPYIDQFKSKNLVSWPFWPNNIISPIPCEMEGISMGSRITAPKNPFPFTCVLVIHHASKNARVMEITVATADTQRECNAEVQKDGLFTIFPISAENKFTNMKSSGSTTDTKKNRAKNILVILQFRFFTVCNLSPQPIQCCISKGSPFFRPDCRSQIPVHTHQPGCGECFPAYPADE